MTWGFFIVGISATPSWQYQCPASSHRPLLPPGEIMLLGSPKGMLSMRHPVYMETKMALYTGYQILAYLHAFIYLVNCKCKHNVLLKMPYNHIRQLVCVVKEYNYIVYALALILLAMAEGRISGHCASATHIEDMPTTPGFTPLYPQCSMIMIVFCMFLWLFSSPYTLTTDPYGSWCLVT